VSAPVPFVDLLPQWREIESDCMPELAELFRTNQFSLGAFVDRFEKAFAEFLRVKHAIGVNSGTSALHLALLAAGIKAGDRVLLPSHTFIATAWAALYIGAVPVLCDVDAATGTIDVDDAARRLAPGTTAIVPVHLYGQPANMTAVKALARAHGLRVVEDACQSHGARYERRMVGGLGDLGCFSFYPGKNLGAPGEAGMVVTDDDGFNEIIRSLRNHGQRQRYIHDRIGFNYRMEGFNGLVLFQKLKRLPSWTETRKAIASRYLHELAGLPLELPQVCHGDHVYHLFVVKTTRRDALKNFLEQHGIHTGLHYPVPLHRQPCLAYLDLDEGSFPNSDRWANECLSLPMFPGMTDEQVTRVIDTTARFFRA
jgi:dTDP-4-amino-4,6-dideoxygalactose transaminase